MLENEVEIEKYVRKKEVDDLIIKKYSTYCDMIPDKKVVDLAPLHRIPCYHLRREFYIKANGKVSACMYSRFINDFIGDINSDDIKDIIDKLKDLYIENAKNQYLEYCKNCNDYYLFNF
jgi:spiro-SPASM protein